MVIQSFRRFFFLLFALCCCVQAAEAVVTQQSANNVLDDGTAWLWVEGESVADLTRINLDGDVLEIGNPNARFIVVDQETPMKTIELDKNGFDVIGGGLDVLPAASNASGGGALFDNWTPEGPNDGPNTATWQMQFEIPATYFMYMHYTMFNRDAVPNYLNEDSIYVPPAFNMNSRMDWVGFEGERFDTEEEELGNSSRDGWMPLSKNVVSKGEVETNDDPFSEFWNGNFHWSINNQAVNMDEDDFWVNDVGLAVKYEVTEEMVGQVLDFQISAREPYGAIDGFLFASSDLLLQDYTQGEIDDFFLNSNVDPGVVGDFDGSGALDLPDVNLLNAEINAQTNNAEFDLTEDGKVDNADLGNWVSVQRKTWFGDANLDGEFNSSDLVRVFQAGTYELEQPATWDQGDWNGDLRFNSGDLVAAFQDGGYEVGPKAAVVVPEPATISMILIGLVALMIKRKKNRVIL
ncbi:MAG: PEP-CTERM sorting domain-containing protein [Planctomycetaceae bacterium]|nr:PEP-CTERM sorting domain-containing protein [Planctomycetaceae bacterium]